MDDAPAFQALKQTLGVALPHGEEQKAVLDLTRVVAHSSERRHGPLAVYALALAISHDATPEQRVDRLRAAIDAIESQPPG